MPARIDLPRDELVSLYCGERLSLEAVASHFGISVCAVVGNLKRYEIQTRNLSESHRGKHSSPTTEFKPGQRPHNEHNLPSDEIASLYRAGLSSVTIAKRYGVTYTPIISRLRSAGIAPRTRREAAQGRVMSPEGRRKLSLNPKCKLNWIKTLNRIRKQGGTIAELHLERELRQCGIHGFTRNLTISTKTLSSAHSYKVDFTWPDTRLGVEVDGSSHKAQASKERDARKDQTLNTLGWHILRFSNEDVMLACGHVIEAIRQALT